MCSPYSLRNRWLKRLALFQNRADTNRGRRRQRERGVFRAKRKRERVSAKPIERHQEVAEAMSRGAQLHEGASKPAVDIVAFRSCGTRVAFAAMNIAACAGAKPARKPNVVFTLLWQHFADRASKV